MPSKLMVLVRVYLVFVLYLLTARILGLLYGVSLPFTLTGVTDQGGVGGSICPLGSEAFRELPRHPSTGYSKQTPSTSKATLANYLLGRDVSQRDALGDLLDLVEKP